MNELLYFSSVRGVDSPAPFRLWGGWVLLLYFGDQRIDVEWPGRGRASGLGADGSADEI